MSTGVDGAGGSGGTGSGTGSGSTGGVLAAAVEAFVRAAAIELPPQRINAVSPTVAEESLPAYGPFFAGMEPVPAARVATAYVRSVEGAQTGQIYRVR